MIPWKCQLPLILVSLLAGCAAVNSIIPHQSTLSDVRAAMGNPTDVRHDSNGDELWEYARGPIGTKTYLIRAGGSGRVQSVTQLLTEERFSKILANHSTMKEVRELLGRPSRKYSSDGDTTWTWHVQLASQDGHFIVRFRADGVVLDTSVLADSGPAGSDNDGLLGNALMR